MEFKFSDIEEFKLRVMGVNMFPMVRTGMKWQSEQKRRDSTIQGGYSMLQKRPPHLLTMM